MVIRNLVAAVSILVFPWAASAHRVKLTQGEQQVIAEIKKLNGGPPQRIEKRTETGLVVGYRGKSGIIKVSTLVDGGVVRKVTAGKDIRLSESDYVKRLLFERTGDRLALKLLRTGDSRQERAKLVHPLRNHLARSKKEIDPQVYLLIEQMLDGLESQGHFTPTIKAAQALVGGSRGEAKAWLAQAVERLSVLTKQAPYYVFN